ncbi:MAG: 23S rRNA (guanosine(2251)-2'-O)-methyltransferase RlmB [Clostridia bacterium]|nr:23S rRNA (guanosine(2251)-2'-O)-methyltransferase RlmB [Clostridia bacterium]MEE1054698.1 23S rRNA (guanosine(2251)-2'-O)-methyltransferase RlmB [Acutalibacteraceae bacterium]
MENKNRDSQSNIICGRNPVLEAVRSGREIDRLLVAHGVSGGSVTAIIAKCNQRGILIKEVSPQKLDYYCAGANHQGVAVMFASQEYSTPEEILAVAKERGEQPFIIVCDEIEDPHNLGAIIRTAEACGVHGIIIPKRRSASLNATVAKSASGALEYMKVARVTNIPNTIDFLKSQGVWVFGADMDGEDYASVDFDMPCALVIGNEGKGIGTLTAKKCDRIVSLPMCGKINSLNASVAAGVLMYEALRKRRKL